MRRKHGLESDRTTILLSAGGFGVGSVEALISALMPLQHRAQVVAICGRNAELKARLARVVARSNPQANVVVRPVGYTQEMDEYMTASDLIVGKPGGLTTCEALAKGLVFVIVNPIPGQEERNSDHLLENGAAIRSNNPATLGYKIKQLLEDPARLEKMRENALAFARPNAAITIAEKLAELSD